MTKRHFCQVVAKKNDQSPHWKPLENHRVPPEVGTPFYLKTASPALRSSFEVVSGHFDWFLDSKW